jgi:hypothetical protein
MAQKDKTSAGPPAKFRISPLVWVGLVLLILGWAPMVWTTFSPKPPAVNVGNSGIGVDVLGVCCSIPALGLFAAGFTLSYRQWLRVTIAKQDDAQ